MHQVHDEGQQQDIREENKRQLCLLLKELKAKSTNKNRAYPLVRIKRFSIRLKRGQRASGCLATEELELCMGLQRIGFDSHST